MIYDPKKRFSPNEALAHDWILCGLPANLQAQHMKLIETPNEFKSSVKIKEILDPTNTKTNQTAKLEASLENETSPTWKSPQSKSSHRVPQSSTFTEQTVYIDKTNKGDTSIEKKNIEDSASQKRLNLNIKAKVDDVPAINAPMNSSDSKRNIVLHQPLKKVNYFFSEITHIS